jgi:uncharacterized protein (DUF433 family)
MFDRITFDAAIMGGRACIRVMRITVALVVNLVANGMSSSESGGYLYSHNFSQNGGIPCW